MCVCSGESGECIKYCEFYLVMYLLALQTQSVLLPLPRNNIESQFSMHTLSEISGNSLFFNLKF